LVVLLEHLFLVGGELREELFAFGGGFGDGGAGTRDMRFFCHFEL